MEPPKIYIDHAAVILIGRALKQQWRLVVFGLFLGVGLAFGVRQVAPRYYTARMIVSPSIPLPPGWGKLSTTNRNLNEQGAFNVTSFSAVAPNSVSEYEEFRELLCSSVTAKLPESRDIITVAGQEYADFRALCLSRLRVQVIDGSPIREITLELENGPVAERWLSAAFTAVNGALKIQRISYDKSESERLSQLLIETGNEVKRLTILLQLSELSNESTLLGANIFGVSSVIDGPSVGKSYDFPNILAFSILSILFGLSIGIILAVSKYPTDAARSEKIESDR